MTSTKLFVIGLSEHFEAFKEGLVKKNVTVSNVEHLVHEKQLFNVEKPEVVFATDIDADPEEIPNVRPLVTMAHAHRAHMQRVLI